MKTQSTYSSSNSLFKASVDGIFSSSLYIQFTGLPENKAYALYKDITKDLSALEKVFDSSKPDSEVSVLNASKVDIETSSEMKSALNLCESYLIKTQSLFNVSKGDNDHLDFAGFIKGYALQRIAAILKKGKVKDAFLNFGDSVLYAVGRQPYCEGWSYTLVNKQTDDELLEYELKNESLAVSLCDGRLCCVKAKDPLEAKVLSLVLPIANPNQRREMSFNFKSLEDSYFDL